LAWGPNDVGELGNGTIIESTTPVAVSLPAGTTVTAIAAGAAHSLALTSTGSVLAWGAGGFLGNGTTTSSTTPVAVSLPAGTTVTAIATGYYHSLALTSTGTVLAWGDNTDGALGNGSTTNSFAPVAVSLPAGTTITGIAAGYFHSLALTSTGSVLAWGDNSTGDLGNGTKTNSTTPIAVSLPAGTTVTAIASGQYHGLAITSTGSVLAWGPNDVGELGNGTIIESTTPVAVSLPAGTTVTAIAAGEFDSLVVTR
jgi:alpha-tubulin suppressor-like RCC1 family protein